MFIVLSTALYNIMFEILFCAVSGSHKNLKLKRTNGRFHVLRGTCFFSSTQQYCQLYWMNLDTCTRVHPYKSRYVAILILGLYVNRQNNCAMSEKGETENIQGQRRTKGV